MEVRLRRGNGSIFYDKPCLGRQKIKDGPYLQFAKTWRKILTSGAVTLNAECRKLKQHSGSYPPP